MQIFGFGGWARPLRRSRARFPLLSPAVTSSPGAGEVFPQRGSQAVKFITKVLGVMRKLLAVLLALPLRKDFPRSGGRCRAATKGGIWHRVAMTERAHAVSPVTKVSNATRNFPVIAKSSPFGGAGTPSGVTERVQPVESLQKTFPQRRAFEESGAANAACLYDPSRENAFGALRRARQTRNLK